MTPFQALRAFWKMCYVMFRTNIDSQIGSPRRGAKTWEKARNLAPLIINVGATLESPCQFSRQCLFEVQDGSSVDNELCGLANRHCLEKWQPEARGSDLEMSRTWGTIHHQR
jgi:hypothetical protein